MLEDLKKELDMEGMIEGYEIPSYSYISKEEINFEPMGSKRGDGMRQ